MTDKKKDIIEVDAVVLEVLNNGICKVQLESGKVVIAYLKGFFKEKKIKVFPQDKVKVEFAPCSLEKGRISYKYRDENKSFNRSPFAKKSVSSRKIRNRKH